MSEDINVTLNINELLKAYNTKDFMQDVYAKAIAKNTDQIASHIRDYVLKDIMKSDLYEDIKKAVLAKLKEEFIDADTKSYGRGYGFSNELSSTIKTCINENKPLINSKVLGAINENMTKESVTNHVTSIVSERVMSALGEVCEGCGLDCYD